MILVMSERGTDDGRHSLQSDLSLRGLGLLSLGVSVLLIRSLVHYLQGQVPHTPPGPLSFLFAALGFLCGSAGGALLTLGHHLFDEVEVSQRWATRPMSRNRDDGRLATFLSENLRGPFDEEQANDAVNARRA